jgi:hypothetical protein
MYFSASPVPIISSVDDVTTFYSVTPTLLLHIREVTGTNIGPETGYPEVFVVSLQENAGIVPLNVGYERVLPPPSHFIIYLSLLHSELCSLNH